MRILAICLVVLLGITNCVFSAPKNAREACEFYSGMKFVDSDESQSTENRPWLVALGYRTVGDEIDFSGTGTLVSDSFIVTAAHSINGTLGRPVQVRLGSGFMPEIKRIMVNRNYTEKRNATYRLTKNDIALIEIERVDLSEMVMPACLYSYYTDIQPEEVLTYSEFHKNVVHEMDLMTMRFNKCSMKFGEIYNKTSVRNVLSMAQYCAHDASGNSDVCHRNGAGPLQLFTSNSTLATVVGIQSFNYENGDSTSCTDAAPTVFTRIGAHIQWIEKIVWKPVNSTEPKPDYSEENAAWVDKIRNIHQ